MKTAKILPDSVQLVDWEENVDLRRLRSNAPKLARKYKLLVGDALLCSGSRYKGARRFQFVILTEAGAMVMVPPTGDLMLSLMLRVGEAAAEWKQELEAA